MSPNSHHATTMRATESIDGDWPPTPAPVKPLSPTDNLFLNIEHPARTYAVSSLFWLDGAVRPELVLRQLRLLCQLQPKFRQRCERGTFWRTAQWVDMHTQSMDMDDNDGSDGSGEQQIRWQVEDHLEVQQLDMDDPLLPPLSTEKHREESAAQLDVGWSHPSLERTFNAFVSRPFDANRPLWRTLLLHHPTQPHSVLCFSAHHCMADGIGFARVMQILMQTTPAVPAMTATTTATASMVKEVPVTVNDGGATLPPSGIPSPPRTPSLPSAPTTPTKSTAAATVHTAATADDLPTATDLHAFMLAVHEQLELWTLSLWTLLTGIWYALVSAIHILLCQRRSFRYPGEQTTRKQAAWTRPIAMTDIAAVRAAYPGITLNDVMVACVERAYTAYMDSLAERTIGSKHSAEAQAALAERDDILTLIIPKGLRAPTDSRFENMASVDYLLLPLQPAGATTEQVIMVAHHGMKRVKASLLAVILKLCADNLFHRIPGILNDATLGRFMNKCHGILTNVPGPPTSCYFGSEEENHRVLGQVIYPPSLCEGSVGIGVVSYNGHVLLGMLADDSELYEGQARALAVGVDRAFERILEDARRVQLRQGTVAFQPSLPVPLISPVPVRSKTD